jgi:hypothetical protein
MLRSSPPVSEYPAIQVDDDDRALSVKPAVCQLRLAASAPADEPLDVLEAGTRRWQPSNHVLWFGPAVTSLPVRSITENQ